MFALPEDLRCHRDWLFSFITVPIGGAVVDLGCGTGDDLAALAARNSDFGARFVGVDAAEKTIATAIEAHARDFRIALQCHRIDGTLPFPDASFDVVYSHNLLECLEDQASFVRELARILRPGGIAVVAHWDWDSQFFDGLDKALVRRLVHAYFDWQQPWMEHADGWMGRRLWGTFNSVHLFDGTVQARVLTNTEFAEPWYGHARAHDFRHMVESGLASMADYERFLADLECLQAEGRYFYSINGYAYVGRRQAW